jgi:hypothetical protein
LDVGAVKDARDADSEDESSCSSHDANHWVCGSIRQPSLLETFLRTLGKKSGGSSIGLETALSETEKRPIKEKKTVRRLNDCGQIDWIDPNL